MLHELCLGLCCDHVEINLPESICEGGYGLSERKQRVTCLGFGFCLFWLFFNLSNVSCSQQYAGNVVDVSQWELLKLKKGAWLLKASEKGSVVLFCFMLDTIPIRVCVQMDHLLFVYQLGYFFKVHRKVVWLWKVAILPRVLYLSYCLFYSYLRKLIMSSLSVLSDYDSYANVLVLHFYYTV